jgi:hypothetical protein
MNSKRDSSNTLLKTLNSFKSSKREVLSMVLMLVYQSQLHKLNSPLLISNHLLRLNLSHQPLIKKRQKLILSHQPLIKEEVKAEPKSAKGASLPLGEHKFKGTFTHKGNPAPLEFVFTVVEGGIISSHSTDAHKYSLNGIVHDGKLTLKQQFDGEGHLEAEFDGDFEANKIRGCLQIKQRCCI